MERLALIVLLVASSATLLLADEVVEPTGVAESDGTNAATKDGKVFSLFTVVTFQNEGCRSSLTRNGAASTALNGTCYTSAECTALGGSAYGNCAAGFGICCVFLITASTGGTITENCTYIRNPGYPNAYTATSQIVYKVAKKQTDVCQIRLDFESFQTLGVANTNEANGGVCQDTLTITATSGMLVPVTCGLMTGQHMYVDMGAAATNSATMTFAFSTTADTTRKWEVKVTQLFCWQDSRAPSGCLQYYPTLTGRYTTFNFGNSAVNVHLQNQNYNICIRRAAGYCCVKHAPCSEFLTSDGVDSGNVQAFALDLTTGTAQSTAAEVDKLCSNDFLGIPGASAECGVGPLHSKFCGSSFVGSQVAGSATSPKAVNAHTGACDCTAPFTAQIFTDALSDKNTATDANVVGISGLCIDFQQLPC